MSQEKKENEEYSKRLYDYDFRDVHKDLEQRKMIGVYGWDHACYHAIAELKAKTDLFEFHAKRSPDEFYIPEVKKLLDNPETQKDWNRIVTFDPYGMTATNPTIASTKAICNLDELRDLNRDGVVVDEQGGVHTTKAAVQYTWNLPALSQRLEVKEEDLRKVLYKYTKNADVLNPDLKTFLPQIGGLTVYIFGDPLKLRDQKAEIAVRVHDECNGSDVFGTDICTCRPYLIFALKACVEVAQRGGVGICVYFRKEGRSLGEVTKYRVYNARKNQEGGDVPSKYFYQTESIAGIRDARFQTMMPDVLNWLGIRRIDWLLSMSNDKYDAIVSAGIKVEQRVPLPDYLVPKNAEVELTAKIMSGYHSEDIKEEEVINELRKLSCIRKQCNRLFELAKQDKLVYFHLHLDQVDKVSQEVVKIIKDKYPDLKIPFHSRIRHFDMNRIQSLYKKWDNLHINKDEQCRRIIDLIMISVLCDAGAGANWQYIDRKGIKYDRSEGLAAATLDMFMEGVFSSDFAIKTRVNSLALKELNVHKLQVGFQVSENNPMIGLEGRCGLIQRLGEAMEKYPDYYGAEVHRPGHLYDYIKRNIDEKTKSVSVNILFKALIESLETIWPSRLSGVRRGDVWSHHLLKSIGKPGSDLIPFHKLLQWLSYSLIEVFQTFGINFHDINYLTALAEYRNGGLLIDTNVITIKDEINLSRIHDVGSELVVEWRALTISLIDIIADHIRKLLNKTPDELPLPCILEGGTWKLGRIYARNKRNGEPPLQIRSDGTVF
jgi:GTP cyclohydrolase II